MPARLKAYADQRLAPAARAETEVVIAGIRDRIAVRDARLPAIESWLTGQGK
jgi:hypothetical protein